MLPSYRKTPESNATTPLPTAQDQVTKNDTVFRLNPLRNVPIENLPLEFQLPYIEVYSSSPRETVATPETNKALFSLNNEIPFIPTPEGILPLPSAEGFRTRPTVTLNGKKAVEGKEYSVVKTEPNRYFLKLPELPGKKLSNGLREVRYIAKFFPAKEKNRSHPDNNGNCNFPPSAKRLAQIAEKVDAAGFHVIAVRVQQLEQAAEEGRHVALESLEQIVAQSGYYSRIPGVRHFGQPWENPFWDFREFLDKDTLCGDCDVANAFTQSMARIALADYPTIHVEKEALLVRDPWQSNLGNDNFHARLEVTDSRFPGLRKTIDATPIRQDPRNPIQTVGPGQRPWKTVPAKGPVEKFLSEAEALFAWHRLRSPGQIELETEGTSDTKAPDPAIALRRTVEDEIQAREKRNREREAQLKNLQQRLRLLGEGAVLQAAVTTPRTDTPHRQVIALARVLREQVQGALTPKEFETALRRFAGPHTETLSSPEALIEAIVNRMHERIDELREREKREPRKSRFSKSVADDLVQPTLATLEYLAAQSWTPMESVSTDAIRSSCENKLAKLLR